MAIGGPVATGGRPTLSQVICDADDLIARLRGCGGGHEPDPLRTMAAVVLQRADEHVDRMVRRMLAAVPLDREAEAGLWVAACRQLVAALVPFAERCAPSDADRAWWRSVGRDGAQYGMTLDEIHQLLVAAHTVFWDVVTETASQLGPQCSQAVLSEAAKVWGTFDTALSWVDDAHSEVAATRTIEFRRLCVELLRTLPRLPDSLVQAERIARALDLDPNGWFVAAVCAPGTPPAIGDGAVLVERPGRTVVLAQPSQEGSEGESLMAQAAAAAHHVTGIGIQRPGLEGAWQSLRDAHMAYAAARPLGVTVVCFREHWLSCIALENREQQEVLVADAVTMLHSDPNTAQTLQAFLDSEGNLVAAGDELGVHPNTVAYRLRQLADRGGVDVRTSDGGALGRVALTLAGITAPRPRPLRRAAS